MYKTKITYLLIRSGLYSTGQTATRKYDGWVGTIRHDTGHVLSTRLRSCTRVHPSYKNRWNYNTALCRTYKSQPRLLGGGQDVTNVPPAITLICTPTVHLPFCTSQSGPLKILTIQHQHIPSYWLPPKRLPYQTSQHILETSISEYEQENLVFYCRQSPNKIIARSIQSMTTKITSRDLRDLLSHGTPTIDDTMALFLEILAHQHNIPYFVPTIYPSTTFRTLASCQKLLRLTSQASFPV